MFVLVNYVLAYDMKCDLDAIYKEPENFWLCLKNSFGRSISPQNSTD